MRVFTFLAAGLVTLGLSAPVAASDFEQTCRYFSNVAYNDLHTGRHESFRAGLARDCVAALTVYERSHGKGHSHDRSESYLVRLHQYRWAMLDIATARFDAAGHRRSGARDLSGHHVVRQVSRTGAYLIARSMGLVGVQREWRAWMNARLEL